MSLRKYIPNTITCLSLFSGCVASVMAWEGDLWLALLWIVAAAVFDFCDGFAARLLKAYSPMGTLPLGTLNAYVPYWAFVIPVFSGLRLAKFNIDERQTSSFIGLPVPAHALLWASAAYALEPLAAITNASVFTVVVMILAFATSLLLVSEIPMFSLKVKSWAWKGNELRYILVVCAVLFVALWGCLGITATILLYIVLSIFNRRNR